MVFLRLHPAVMIGDTYLFSAEPFGACPDATPDETVRCETDPTIIEKLLACMEGTTDYPWITPEERRKKFEDLFHRESRVWIMEIESEIVGFLWETRQSYRYIYGDRTLILDDLPDDAAFLEFMFIGEAWRRRGFHHSLLAAAHRASPNVRFSSAITEDNEPSIRSHTKYGFRQSGRILHFRCFGLVFASFCFGEVRRLLFRIRKDVPYRISCRKGA
jgi:RimJ/RimL family protein N-acetyltransferase